MFIFRIFNMSIGITSSYIKTKYKKSIIFRFGYWVWNPLII